MSLRWCATSTYCCTKKKSHARVNEELEKRATMTLLNLDGALFLKKRLICACLRCFSLLIVLLESVMQCVILVFCCVFIIADCRISKKQACSAGRLLAGGRYRVTLREAYEKFFENERLADGQADFSFLCTLYVLSQCVY